MKREPFALPAFTCCGACQFLVPEEGRIFDRGTPWIYFRLFFHSVLRRCESEQTKKKKRNYVEFKRKEKYDLTCKFDFFQLNELHNIK